MKHSSREGCRTHESKSRWHNENGLFKLGESAVHVPRARPAVAGPPIRFCLSNDILVELRQLLNFQYDSETCLSILLCGQDDLMARLKLSILEPLANSVTTTVFMKPLNHSETGSYLEERLKLAGARGDLFGPPAVRAIHNASHGVMRSINGIASGALVKAWRIKADTVESELITALTSEG